MGFAPWLSFLEFQILLILLSAHTVPFHREPMPTLLHLVLRTPQMLLSETFSAETLLKRPKQRCYNGDSQIPKLKYFFGQKMALLLISQSQLDKLKTLVWLDELPQSLSSNQNKYFIKIIYMKDDSPNICSTSGCFPSTPSIFSGEMYSP